MSITLEPNKGLRLRLDRFSPIRTWHGGGKFWSHEFQLTVRQGALSAFLPRAMEDDDSVLFEHRVGGVELASTSTAITNMSQVPARELQNLRDAVDELKSKAEDPRCDRTKRQMIESFRLPDPQKDRDLYRLVGKGSQQKLIVLWGIEREEGSALAPSAAVDLMNTPAEESPPVGAKKSKLIPVLICLAVLGAAGWYYWQQEQQKELAAAEAAKAEEQARIAAFNAKAATTPDSGSTASAGNANPAPAEGTVIQDEDGTVVGVTDKDGAIVPADPGTKVDKDGKTITAAEPGDVVKDEKGAVTGVVDKNGKITAATPGKVTDAEPGKPVTALPGTVVRDSKGTVTGVVAKDGKVTAASSGTTADKNGKVTSSKPGTVFRDEHGTVTGVGAKDGKVVAVKPGAIVKQSDFATSFRSTGTGTTLGPGHNAIVNAPSSVLRNSSGVVGSDGKAVSATSGTVVDKDGKTVTGVPGTVYRDNTGVVTGVAGTDGKIVAAPDAKLGHDAINHDSSREANGSNAPTTPTAPPAVSPGSVTTPMTTKGPPPAGISSLNVVSTSLSTLLEGGNVEVLLNVVARDPAGAVVNAPPINEWRVDGVVQKKVDGSLADGPVLPTSLPAGKHNISTVGRGADGNPFQTDAEVIISPKQ